MLTIATLPGVAGLFRSTLLTLNPSLPLDSVRTDLLFFVELPAHLISHKLIKALDVFSLWSIGLPAAGFASVHKCRAWNGYIVSGTLLIILTALGLLWPV